MKRRVTLKDIAAQTGYHFTTVSLALRGHPSLPEATRGKIRRTAEKMGYAPDPMLRALTAYRQKQKPSAAHVPIAWLSSGSRSEAGPDYLFAHYLAGARKRAR
ncbi:MAG: helix-turn-helix domain-containing protein, partial [Verrucomicrobiota bacterium]